MKIIFNKMILAVLTAALVFAAFPASAAFAQSENPPQQKPELTNEKMEEIWARQLKLHERLGKLFSDTERLDKLQELIDAAKANGKDVAALQIALNNFETALKNAKPVYESMNGVVNSHQGFDANGKVTDAEKAKATLKTLRDKMKEFKTAMGETGKALHEALKAFREANKPSK